MPKKTKKYSSNLDDLTLDEIGEVCELAPQLLPEDFNTNGLNAIRVTTFLQLKRDNPNATLDDAGSVRWGDIDI